MPGELSLKHVLRIKYLFTANLAEERKARETIQWAILKLQAYEEVLHQRTLFRARS